MLDQQLNPLSLCLTCREPIVDICEVIEAERIQFLITERIHQELPNVCR